MFVGTSSRDNILFFFTNSKFSKIHHNSITESSPRDAASCRMSIHVNEKSKP